VRDLSGELMALPSVCPASRTGRDAGVFSRSLENIRRQMRDPSFPLIDRWSRQARGRTAWAWLANLVRPPPPWGFRLVLLTVQTAVIVGLVAKWPSRGGTEFRTLRGPTTQGQPSGPQARLRVAFKRRPPNGRSGPPW
jgi:hypothetical protein